MEAFKIFQEYNSDSSILDDFPFFESKNNAFPQQQNMGSHNPNMIQQFSNFHNPNIGKKHQMQGNNYYNELQQQIHGQYYNQKESAINSKMINTAYEFKQSSNKYESNEKVDNFCHYKNPSQLK
jgi:hypothetical protein